MLNRERERVIKSDGGFNGVVVVLILVLHVIGAQLFLAQLTALSRAVHITTFNLRLSQVEKERVWQYGSRIGG